MAYTGYDCLRIDLHRGVATVTIDHPPINLFDLALIGEMDRVGRELEADGDVRSTFQGLLVASLQAIAAHPHATVVYQHDVHYFRETPRFRYVRMGADRVRQTWMDLLEAGAAEGVFRNDIPARHMYMLLRDGLWLSVRWFRPVSAYGVEEFAADCCRIYYQAFASDESLHRMLERRTTGRRAAERPAPPVPIRGRRA